MKVLVTGGTGVVGEGAVTALLKAGYEVRILAREAGDRAREWPKRVEAFPADVTDPTSLFGAANGCDTVVHVTGIVEEKPPETTFTKVNVEGTDHVLAEAKRAGVRRFVYISSLGAERGKSAYHESKRRAEDLVRASKFEWVILRAGNVYGPGDEVISTFLTLFRTLPAVPIIGDGNRQFQPIWYRDLGEAIAFSVEQPDVAGRTLEVAGDEITTMNELVERFERITGRKPARVPVPELLAGAGVAFANLFGVDVPLNDAKLTMLIEENVVHAPEGNALLRAFNLTPTSLDDGLRELADALPEQLPREGYGSLERKRYWAEISDTYLTPQQILERFREHVRDVMPIEFSAEPGAPQRIEPGATMTLHLPLRGNVQVRVVECTKDQITLATVEGHPLAGVVRFRARKNGSGTHFEIETLTRPASVLDYVAMKTVGNWFQEANWVEVVERVVDLVKGYAASGVATEAEMLDDDQAATVEREIEELVTRYRHDRHVTEIQY
jgi:NADH dehydrogenase